MLLPLLGMMTRVLHPEFANHELALPMLLRHDLPVWLGALGLAALVSAEVSTADAIPFMLSTSLPGAGLVSRAQRKPTGSAPPRLRVNPQGERQGCGWEPGGSGKADKQCGRPNECSCVKH